MKKAGITLTFHGLGHGHASLMLAAGVHLEVASERLGPSTIGITADLYTRVAERVPGRSAVVLRPKVQVERLEPPTVTPPQQTEQKQAIDW